MNKNYIITSDFKYRASLIKLSRDNSDFRNQLEDANRNTLAILFIAFSEDIEFFKFNSDGSNDEEIVCFVKTNSHLRDNKITDLILEIDESLAVSGSYNIIQINRVNSTYYKLTLKAVS